MDAWPSDARRDRLIGDFHIYQRTGGHRTSTDDLVTAWYAVHRAGTRPRRYLDLGCGIGSVLLMVAHRLRPERSRGIEAQAQSALLAARAIEELPETAPAIALERADFREVDFGVERYDLITGSPPYFALSAGVLPADAQRRACRFEERGGVEVYFAAAARALTPDGRFYLVFQTRGEERVMAAAAATALQMTGRARFHMKADRPEPFLTVFEYAHPQTTTPHEFTCAVRSADGTLTGDYLRLRAELGVDLAESEEGPLDRTGPR